MSLGRARALLDAVQADPRGVADDARLLLGSEELAPIEQVGALWALGRALSELDEVEEACRTLAEAISVAEGADERSLAAEVRVSLSVCRLTAGQADEAASELRRAESDIPPGGPTGRLVMQRGLLAIYAGRLSEALVDLDDALPLLEAAGDELARCRLLGNRGVVLAFLGQLDRATTDLETCRDLATALGQDMAAGAALHNLGFVRGRRGDVPGALADLREAREVYERLGAARLVANLDADMCAVLLAGGLLDEAATVAERAATVAAAAGNRLTEAEARLLHAQALLARGEAASAHGVAEQAAATFRAADRGPWASIAAHVAFRAEVADGRLGVEDLSGVLDLAGELEDHGWIVEAAGARTFAGRLALEVGQVELARRALAGADAGRRHGPAAVRASAWQATAMLRLADGDRRGARRALAAGMRLIAAHQAGSGSTELRVHAAAQGAELARLGLRLAVEDGSPTELLRWAERWRAGALSLPPVRPPRDGRLAALLDDLRALEAEQRDALLAGGEVDLAGRTARAALEDEIRAVARTSAGHGVGGARLDVAALDARLAERRVTMVELVEVDDELHALVGDGRGWDAHALGTTGGLGDDVARVLSAVRRLALARSSVRSLDAARHSIESLGRSLDERVIAPLDLDPRVPLVVVPTGDLQRLPWSVLPSLVDREVVVAPSAALWARATDAVTGDGPVVLVGGPDLVHVERELDLLAVVHEGATVIRPAAASASAVLDAVAGAGLVHLAAHGVLRADSPLFTSLRMSDGSLTIYDLEHLSTAPRTVILPACDAGASAVARGDELVGTAAALLSLGVAQVVAPFTVVPDDATVDLVVDLHRHLVGGVAMGAALAAARVAALERGRPQDVAAAHAFVVLGAS